MEGGPASTFPSYLPDEAPTLAGTWSKTTMLRGAENVKARRELGLTKIVNKLAGKKEVIGASWGGKGSNVSEEVRKRRVEKRPNELDSE